MDVSQKLKDAQFVYRKPSELQKEMAKKRCPWLFEPEKIVDLRNKKEE